MTKENVKRERTKESKEKEDTSSARAARAREELFSDKLYAAALSAIETAGKEHKPPHPRQVISMAATGKGLIVSGEYGVGKTALASLAARAFGGGVFKVRLAIPDDLDRLTRSWQEYYLEDAASDKSEFYESELYVCSPTMQEVERAAIADAKRYIEEDRI